MLCMFHSFCKVSRVVGMCFRLVFTLRARRQPRLICPGIYTSGVLLGMLIRADVQHIMLITCMNPKDALFQLPSIYDILPTYSLFFHHFLCPEFAYVLGLYLIHFELWNQPYWITHILNTTYLLLYIILDCASNHLLAEISILSFCWGCCWIGALLFHHRYRQLESWAKFITI